MSKLHVTVEHGGQRVEFDSPAGENNPEIIGDEFGLSLGDLNPAKHVARTAKKAASVGAKGISRFTRTAANAAGHGAHSLTKVTNKITGEVSDAARSLPVVGKPLHAAIGAALEPVKLTAAVVGGRRIDKAVVDSFRRSVHAAETLAPYAQLVVSAVPGIGTGLSAAVAGGLVLAEGRPVNEAVIAAARAAVPGGPMAAAAFNASVAVASGESVNSAAVEAAVAAAAPDEASRSRLKAALEVASGVSKGKPIDKVALSAAAHALPAEAQARAEASVAKKDASSKVYDELTSTMPTAVSRAMVSGIALGVAKGSQQDLHAAITSTSGVASLKKAGAEVVAKSDVMKTAANEVPDKGAFDLGIGLMRHSGVTQPAVNYLRDRLSPRGKVSFDSALAIHVGAVSNSRITAETRHKVGFYAVAGSLAGDPNQRAGIVKLLSKNPEAKSGAAAAVKLIRRRRSLWRRIIEWLKGTKGSA